jgi:ABC-2 type transport system permease protein
MSTQSNAAPESVLDSQVGAPAAMSATRPLVWSVRRELWENRSIYLAPLVVAGFALLGYLISTIHLPRSMRAVSELDPVQQGAALAKPYSVVAMLIMVTGFIVGLFYCLDALHGERRDRSILFWKSLPVSDLTTVLSKASIPLVVLPLLTFAIVVVTQLVMLLASSAVLLGAGLSAAPLWTQLHPLQMQVVLLYGLTVAALWYAPVYGWLLLVSAWARRAAFLWAVLPPLALCVVEKIAFHTSYSASMLKHRLRGGFDEAFAVKPSGPAPGVIDHLDRLDPVRLLSSPGLWIGLLVAAALLAAAVRLRRYRGPI